MSDREKYLERQRRYNTSAKGRARQGRYEATRIRLRTAGVSTTLRVPEEAKEYFLKKIAVFNAKQRDEYREFVEKEEELGATNSVETLDEL